MSKDTETIDLESFIKFVREQNVNDDKEEVVKKIGAYLEQHFNGEKGDKNFEEILQDASENTGANEENDIKHEIIGRIVEIKDDSAQEIDKKNLIELIIKQANKGVSPLNDFLEAIKKAQNTPEQPTEIEQYISKNFNSNTQQNFNKFKEEAQNNAQSAKLTTLLEEFSKADTNEDKQKAIDAIIAQAKNIDDLSKDQKEKSTPTAWSRIKKLRSSWVLLPTTALILGIAIASGGIIPIAIAAATFGASAISAAITAYKTKSFRKAFSAPYKMLTSPMWTLPATAVLLALSIASGGALPITLAAVAFATTVVSTAIRAYKVKKTHIAKENARLVELSSDKINPIFEAMGHTMELLVKKQKELSDKSNKTDAEIKLLDKIQNLTKGEFLPKSSVVAKQQINKDTNQTFTVEVSREAVQESKNAATLESAEKAVDIINTSAAVAILSTTSWKKLLDLVKNLHDTILTGNIVAEEANGIQEKSALQKTLKNHINDMQGLSPSALKEWIKEGHDILKADNSLHRSEEHIKKIDKMLENLKPEELSFVQHLNLTLSNFSETDATRSTKTPYQKTKHQAHHSNVHTK
jgi:hypothetical protein